jgi:hypothetical protein
MRMPRVLAGLLVMGLSLGQPVPGRAQNGASEAGLAVGAALANIVYVPVKAVVAVGGLALGTFAALLTGGDTRAAYALWVPAASGTYILTPACLDGSAPLKFFGSDYADRPSNQTKGGDGSSVYESLYY